MRAWEEWTAPRKAGVYRELCGCGAVLHSMAEVLDHGEVCPVLEKLRAEIRDRKRTVWRRRWGSLARGRS